VFFLQGQGDFDRSIPQFYQAVALEPYNPDLDFTRGLTKADMGDHHSALADFTQAVELDETFSAAYYQRAMSRMVIPIASVTDLTNPSLNAAQRDELELAIQDFSSALEYSPNFVAAHYYRGLSHYAIGHESLAWKDYQQARTLSPMIANGFYRQGFTQLYIGGPSVY